MPQTPVPMMPRLIALFLGMQAIGFAGTWLHTRGADTERTLRIRRKFLVFFCITTGVFLSIYLRYPFILLAALIVALGLLEVGRLSSMNRTAAAVALPTYGVIGLGFFLFALKSSVTVVLSVYAVIVALDGFSQVSGQLFGKRLLAPTISPSKTMEGFLGGAAASALAYTALASFDLDIRNAAALGVILLAGLAGDLLGSGYKRAAEVKDFGDLIPYHGGVLDRFDSFMMAGFAYYAVSLIDVTL